MGKTRELEGLELLRKPFEEHHISKLPKPTRAQTDELKADFRKGIRCDLCGGWHHPAVVHLDYVGHAALTNRLLEVDPMWNWEPLAVTDGGLPLFDDQRGLWIKLTILGITRLGYGSADNKTGGDAIKEIIGDALRNAAMRFGAALELWHKGDFWGEDYPGEEATEKKAAQLLPVDVERLKTEKGMMYLAKFKTAEEALELARKSNYVSEEAERDIRDIWDAAQQEKRGSNENL